MKKICLVLAVILFSQNTFSATSDTGWVTIDYIGGEYKGLKLKISQKVGNQINCESDQIMFPASALSSDVMNRFYSAMLAAAMSGKKLK